MKKAILAVCIVVIGSLVFANYRYWKVGGRYETINNQDEMLFNYSIELENQLQYVDLSIGDTISGSYLKELGEKYYRNGIDTVFVLDGDTYFLRDLSEFAHFVVSQTDSNVHIHENGNNYEYWYYYLSKPHPSVFTINKYFKEASDEFNVPVEILYAIGQVENNWTQIGPSIDQGWGIMHLVDNNYCNTLLEAAILLNVSSQELKDNARENIRGAAALLSKYADIERSTFSGYEEWYPAMKKFTGLINDDIQSMQLQEYLRVLYKGSQSVTLWGEDIILLPQYKNH